MELRPFKGKFLPYLPWLDGKDHTIDEEFEACVRWDHFEEAIKKGGKLLCDRGFPPVPITVPPSEIIAKPGSWAYAKR